MTECYQFTSKLDDCTNAKNGVPADFTAKTDGALNAIATLAGVITATPNTYKGIVPEDKCVLTPTAAAVGGTADAPAAASGYLKWTFSDACVTKGWVGN